MSALGADFYDRPTLEVARDLLGCRLVHETPEGTTSGRIVEVEAYHGEDDPACHAAVGLTRRTAPLYGPPGTSYVYRIYGMYHCLNAVTRAEGLPSAVLIRALEPLEGQALMRRRRARRRGGGGDGIPDRALADGPGKLCDAMGVTLEHNRRDLASGELRIEAGEPPREVGWSPRIGISAATDRLWRGVVAGSPYVSRSKLNRAAGPEPWPPTR